VSHGRGHGVRVVASFVWCTLVAVEITFFYDVVCPYAYLASTRIEAVAAAHGARVSWQPILLGGLFRHVGAPQRPGDVMAAPKARLVDLDMKRWAQVWGVELCKPVEHPRRTVEAMRLLVGARSDVRVALSRDLFEAYWVRGEDVADRAVLDATARRHGVDPAIIDDAEVRTRLFESTAVAARHGAFGVPTFVVGDRIVWGQDRFALLERLLGATEIDPAAPHAETTPAEVPLTVRFFHDFSSPFSYLASTQIERIVAKHGATLEWLPMLVGGLFREIGTPDVPMLAMNEAKERYLRQDMQDWAAAWGVPFSFPSHFPLRTVLPLRAALVEPAITPVVYRAAWAHDRRIDEPTALAAVLGEAGFDAAAILARCDAPEIKAALRDNTAAAQAAGACGVPTFEVRRPDRDPVLLWGQDRLSMLADVLGGWWPSQG
jgi:2-hydroxychromene-2-carboxylate isomerase